MTFPKLLGIVAIFLFGVIGIVALLKKTPAEITVDQQSVPLEVELDKEIQTVMPALAPPPPSQKIEVMGASEPFNYVLPEADRIDELFNKEGSKLPIVETITYRSRVAWQKGRPAWLSDYAGHYQTSRHFIARSLNGKPDYLKQELSEGAKFNVLKKDKNFEFALVVDTSRCKMWFYYTDLDEKKNVLLKTYQVGLGRLDTAKTSGLLTPLGKYTLADRVAIFKPKTMAPHQGEKVEMITVFGTRWIPFGTEIGKTTAPAKGFGIHGTPWIRNAKGELVDQAGSIGKYESDGCIRLATADMEELFAIIITKPTTIEIVRNFYDSSLAEK